MMACLVVTPYRPHPTFGTSRVGPIVSRVTLKDDSRTERAVGAVAHRPPAPVFVTRITVGGRADMRAVAGSGGARHTLDATPEGASALVRSGHKRGNHNENTYHVSFCGRCIRSSGLGRKDEHTSADRLLLPAKGQSPNEGGQAG